ncbi:hypothetical protein, partial [Pseudomonas sp. p106]|uniref:hypothetical protein n=1 Tax=Pseudomonas sp. p106 TaxID=2479854 RepID=UPI001C49AB38
FLVTFWGVCQKVTRRKGGKVSERRHRKWICPHESKPSHELLASGFWLLASGFWLLASGFQLA